MCVICALAMHAESTVLSGWMSCLRIVPVSLTSPFPCWSPQVGCPRSPGCRYRGPSLSTADMRVTKCWSASSCRWPSCCRRPSTGSSVILSRSGPTPGPVLSELSFLVSVDACWLDTADSSMMIVTMSPTFACLLVRVERLRRRAGLVRVDPQRLGTATTSNQRYCCTELSTIILYIA